VELQSVDPCLHGAYRKLLRARELATQIETEVLRVTVLERPTLEYERLEDGRLHQWRIHGLSDLDPMFPLWVGDCFHNYRTVLDHIAWLLVELTGKQPSIRTKFPLTPDDSQGEQLTVDPSIPPGHRVNEVVKLAREIMSGQGEHASLAHLSRLDNADKHQVLLLSGARLSYATLEFPDSSLTLPSFANGNRLSDGSIVVIAHDAELGHHDVPVELELIVRLDDAHQRITRQPATDPVPPHPQSVLPLIDSVDGEIATQLLPKAAEILALAGSLVSRCSNRAHYDCSSQ